MASGYIECQESPIVLSKSPSTIDRKPLCWKKAKLATWSFQLFLVPLHGIGLAILMDSNKCVSFQGNLKQSHWLEGSVHTYSGKLGPLVLSRDFCRKSGLRVWLFMCMYIRVVVVEQLVKTLQVYQRVSYPAAVWGSVKPFFNHSVVWLFFWGRLFNSPNGVVTVW
jgi:hypothetical protein